MAKPDEPYFELVVECFVPESMSGRRGRIHIRPVDATLRDVNVACPSGDMKDYVEGTRFRIWAKWSDRQGGKPYLIGHRGSGYEVLG